MQFENDQVSKQTVHIKNTPLDSSIQLKITKQTLHTNKAVNTTTYTFC
uniref:Uncharacterized protein n=1 Tax=Anguilla anguilla TaxID=7936 RepID=A0A0E9R645_ANGAN